MLLAVDVYYYDENKAKTVGIIFEKWESQEPTKILTKVLDKVPEYEPGSFYKRELPCIIELLKIIDMSNIDIIIIDGYVYLEQIDSPGLGLHLYNFLGKKYTIIGVAKTYYQENIAEKIYRGKSKIPLYITSIGIEPSEAMKCIETMYGSYRIPKLLKLLDQKTKEI
jgi:deoxyribonuclease V